MKQKKQTDQKFFDYEILKSQASENPILNGTIVLNPYTNKIEYLGYVPFPHQLQLHNSSADFKMLIAGNKAGKSSLAVMESLIHCAKIYPDWHNKKLRHHQPIAVAYSGPSFEATGKILKAKIDKFCPKRIKYKKLKKNGVTAYYEFPDGSYIDLKSYTQETDKWAGGDYHIWVFDEPPPKDLFLEAARGVVANDGVIIFGFSPLKKSYYVKEDIIDRKDTLEELGIGEILIVKATIHDNPTLSSKQKNKLLANCNDTERQAREFGEFTRYSGVVYPEYSEANRIPLSIVPRDITIYQFIDPHPRKPFAAIWIGIDKFGIRYVIAEFPTDPFHRIETSPYRYDNYKEIYGEIEQELSGTFQYEDTVNGGIQVFPRRVYKRFRDPRTNLRDMSSGIDFDIEMKKRGFPIIPAYLPGTRNDIHQRLRNYLGYDEVQPVDEVNHPMLYIADHLYNTDYSFRHHVFDEYSGKMEERKGLSGKEEEKFKCFVNLVEMAVFQKMTYTLPSMTEESYNVGPLVKSSILELVKLS